MKITVVSPDDSPERPRDRRQKRKRTWQGTVVNPGGFGIAAGVAGGDLGLEIGLAGGDG
jgi:hypothetical protein